jgi:tripartite-type tricarboxylate transporter receptor subunit TctC
MKFQRREFLRREFLKLGAAAVAAPSLSRSAFAQAGASAWPTRVVRLIVGFPPGGGADSAARIAAGRLSELWGQQVVVENKGGAGGNIAHDAAAHAPPDGYTMLFSPSSLPIMPMLYASLNYDPMTDLVPISLLGKYPNLIVVSKTSPMNSLKDFIDNAKANPGKVTFATPGIGTTPHLTAELFKQMAKLDLTHVPYRGVAAGAMSDLMTDRIDSMFNTTGSLLQAVRSGQVRGLAQSAAERSPLAPELPTFAEAGVPGFNVSSWYGLFVAAKTPREIVAKMHGSVAAMLQEPAIKARYEVLGIEATSATPEQLTATMRREIELWGPIVKAANIKGE